MEVYFVRHGETDGNVGKRHQLTHTVLSPVGIAQAKEVADLLTAQAPTHLVSSNLVRALDTAKTIGAERDLTPETSPLFREVGRPEVLYGNFLFSIRSLWFYFWWCLGWYHWHGEEAESYRELRKRIALARQYLESLPSNSRVVVVSHSIFISFFVAHRCRRGPLGPFGIVRTFCRMISMPNTGVTRLRYVPDAKQRCRWQLVQSGLESS